MLRLLHLCDSLFPLGSFAHSDGLETATTDGRIVDAAGLRAWMDACLDETIGRFEGPAAWRAWQMVVDAQWEELVAVDVTVIAMRPSGSARRVTRGMGQRLLTTWRTLYPHPQLDLVADLVALGALAPSLPIAFAAVCASAGTSQRETVEALAYTRLAATVSAAMRLAPIGQTDAHLALARTLDRVPEIVNAIASSDAGPESFAPLMDVAAMSQQYLHSRLFRS